MTPWSEILSRFGEGTGAFQIVGGALQVRLAPYGAVLWVPLTKIDKVWVAGHDRAWVRLRSGAWFVLDEQTLFFEASPVVPDLAGLGLDLGVGSQVVSYDELMQMVNPADLDTIDNLDVAYYEVCRRIASLYGALSIGSVSPVIGEALDSYLDVLDSM